MKRKTFIKAAGIASVGAMLPFDKSIPGIFPNERILPRRLKTGDTLGLIAPGSYITGKELNDSIKSLNELGFNVVYTNNILSKNGYFSGSDKQRASDLNQMFYRDDVAGIICARGGYGCTRILPLLNYNVISTNPKVFIGYSDVTSLLYGLYKETGLVCFHGPVGISTYNDFTDDYFRKTLMDPEETTILKNPVPESGDEEYQPLTIKDGVVRGELIGGNLSVAVSLIGTPYDIDTGGRIIFLEEMEEDPYRIDRMLTQMRMAGKFDRAAGIALGVFKDCKPSEKSSFDSSFTLIEVLKSRLGDLNIPVVYGMSFGHVKNKFILPVGIKAELDASKQTITLLEKPTT
ncbi:MAG TPA: LD-carboxypeptidase [Ignavibacteriaceae bacterium]|jgi:muramoyltetrapeptide carboxypeptidase|nr:LD-carboxypeptidase [Ignavibacteriaceae bacterium]